MLSIYVFGMKIELHFIESESLSKKNRTDLA